MQYIKCLLFLSPSPSLPFSPLLFQQIDGEAFLLLTQVDLVKILSIKLGPALKIYNSILMFKTAEDSAYNELWVTGQSDCGGFFWNKFEKEKKKQEAQKNCFSKKQEKWFMQEEKKKEKTAHVYLHWYIFFSFCCHEVHRPVQLKSTVYMQYKKSSNEVVFLMPILTVPTWGICAIFRIRASVWLNRLPYFQDPKQEHLTPPSFSWSIFYW